MTLIGVEVERPINDEIDIYITNLINKLLAESQGKVCRNVMFSKQPYADAEGSQTFFLVAEVDE